MTSRSQVAALAVALSLCAPDARADDAAVGLAPVGILVPLAVVGGLITTIALAIDVGDGDKAHPAMRNVALGCAGFNILAGTGGLIAGALIDDDDLRPVIYAVGGAVWAIGLTGGVLGLVVDTYNTDPGQATLAVSPTAGGAVWSVSGSF
jgi:hypothetical protein